jgi:hypothetical protein
MTMLATQELTRAIAEATSAPLAERADWWVILEFKLPTGGTILEEMDLSLPVGMSPFDLLLSNFASDTYGVPLAITCDYLGIPRENKES